MAEHEIKGAWFVAAREEVAACVGQEALEVLVAGLPGPHQKILREATSHRWYPEQSLQSCLRSLRLQLAGHPSVSFGELLERCTERGMGRFFSTVVGFSSPRFVLGHVPRMWGVLRRGPGFVTVQHGTQSTLLQYREFPFFSDPVYEELTVHSVRALVRRCTDADPTLTIERAGPDALDLRVGY
ncbi:MAG TPA: hypothetical protein ENK57_11435 [Polyangiaceae bacterium]|nr:hypothetical protein [Polyangiaceae bacterium]